MRTSLRLISAHLAAIPCTPATRYLETSVGASRGIDDAVGWSETRRTMKCLGLRDSEGEAVFACLAAVLMLGNVAFTRGGDGRAAESTADGGDAVAELASTADLQMAAERLGVSPPGLTHCLLHRKVEGKNSVYFVPYSTQQAADVRDALAKAVYQRLFELILSSLNTAMAAAEEGSPHTRGRAPPRTAAASSFIGLLDIFGFECFTNNSLEQVHCPCRRVPREAHSARTARATTACRRDRPASLASSW